MKSLTVQTMAASQGQIIHVLPLLSKVHSFFHSRNLYSAPSRYLLRSAPGSSTAKNRDSSNLWNVGRLFQDSKCSSSWSPFKVQGHNNRKGLTLSDREEPALGIISPTSSWGATSLDSHEVRYRPTEVGRSTVENAVPDQRNNPIRDKLRDGKPMQYITHGGTNRDTWDRLRNMTNESSS